jgi:Mg-chelatase subunit ChlD
MRRRIVLTAVLLLIAVAAHAQPRGAVDWVFLIDTSKSMRGIGGKNIFPDVKASIASFVREASDGDSVTILTFDSDVRLHASMEIRGTARDDLISIVDTLEANGNRTHLGLAIQRGLERADQLRAGGDKTRVQSVVLFTDGEEDVRGIAHPVPISASVERVDGTYVFFVSMGEREHEKQLDEFARHAKNATVLRAPTRDAIHDVERNIRAKIDNKTRPPAVITIKPASLDFGDVRRGKPAEADVTIDADRHVQVALQLTSAPDGVTMEPQTVTTPARVHLRIDVAGDVAPGRATLTFKAGSATAAGTLNITRPSPLRWLVLLPLVAAIVWFAWSRHRRNNQLEGEIEIMQPRVAPDAAFVGLPRLSASEVVLSAIIPPDALGGTDARLFVRRSGGRKEVWIAASNGSMRVNDVETPTSALYDADTISIGDAKLRFNRVGHERTDRPVEEEL